MLKRKISREEKIPAVKEYLSGSNSQRSIAGKYGVTVAAFQRWLNKFQSMGEGGFEEGRHKSYSEELKEQAVVDYLSGAGSQTEICRKYQIKSTTQLRLWILKYNNHEPLKSYAGGRGKAMVKGRKTTLEERIDIVKDHMESGSSYEETSEKHQISYQQIYQWVRKYQENGIDGLVDRRGRRKEQDAMTEEEKLRAELKLEKAKNKRLEMENLFLKKLKEIERRRY